MNPVELFYKNSNILVTGGNGFLGCILIEKLLRCFDVKRIYLLIRSKRNQSVEERSRNFFNNEVFDEIRENRSELINRITFVEVDYTQEDLKIQGNIRDEILSSVEIVFHVMASVRFDEPLKDAVDINMLATKKMLALAEKMTNLKSYLHVSTLYSNSNRLEDDVVDEIIYDHRLSYEQLIYISKISEQNPALVAKLFQNSDPRDNFPNTYTLTKHFAEKIVASYSSYLPCGIFRPPIVFSSYDDHRGYLQNFNGPSAFSAMLDKGFFRVLCCDGWKKTNIIPVDYCMNASIVMAWDVHQKFIEKKRQIPIYNYTFKRNNMTWREMIDISFSNEKLLKRFTSKYLFWFVSSYRIYLILDFIFHMLPALILDIFMRKPVFYPLYKKLFEGSELYRFFTKHQWNFKNDNIKKLLEKTKSFKYKDGTMMEFDARKIDWKEFSTDYWIGIRKLIRKLEMKHKLKNKMN